MTIIPMLGIRLFDPEHTTHFLKQRFMTHLKALRAKSAPNAPEELPAKSFKFGNLSEADIDKIDRRVERIIKARAALREVGHLKEEDRRALQPPGLIPLLVRSRPLPPFLVPAERPPSGRPFSMSRAFSAG